MQKPLMASQLPTQLNSTVILTSKVLFSQLVHIQPLLSLFEYTYIPT